MWYQGCAIHNARGKHKVFKRIIIVLAFIVIIVCAIAWMIITSPYL